MKKLFFIGILFFLSCEAYSQYNVVTWDDILLERSVEELHNILSKSDDDAEREFMENHLLIREDGYLMDNKYFDSYTTKRIKEKYLDKNMFNNKKVFFKVFKVFNKERVVFLKATVKETEKKYYVFFETTSASKYKNDLYFKHYNTLALFVYKYEKEKGEFSLENTEIFRH